MCLKINVVAISRATLKVKKKLQLLVFKLKSLLKLPQKQHKTFIIKLAIFFTNSLQT